MKPQEKEKNKIDLKKLKIASTMINQIKPTDNRGMAYTWVGN